MNTKIIGFKNVTDSAGATSLIYILKKHLEKNYKVMAIEFNKNDFKYYKDPKMYSVDDSTYQNIIIKAKENDVVLMDLNNSNVFDDCDEVFYLIEPSIIKINKLINRNRNIFKELNGKKIILNKSLISSKDVKEFEYESRSKIFYNMPALNDRDNNSDIVNQFLNKIGFDKQIVDKKRGFGWFK